MQCGLLGETLKHSYSPQIHSYFASYPYDLYEKTPEELDAFLRSDTFTGLNVTIPYKKAVVSYCSELTPIAKQLGSVNTIVRKDDGTLLGHNTDYFGFSYLLKHSGLSVCGKKVLVLGSGGSSVTVCAVLRESGAQVIVVSRSGEHNYKNLTMHADASVIVNTTPVGMFPNNGTSPVDLALFPKLEGVLDIIYNPTKTKLLLDAEARKIVAVNGLRMLIAQAKESAELFSDTYIPDALIEEVYHNLNAQIENIVLIGMPGCGKSTVGKYLADLLRKDFVDTDSAIEAQADMTIPEIFKTYGEAIFRDAETGVLRDYGMMSGLVIATGGGCVTKEENYNLLRQNSRVVWIQRDLTCLTTEGRPLSQSTNLSVMLAARFPLYQRFSDYSVNNSGTPEETAKKIIMLLQGENVQ